MTDRVIYRFEIRPNTPVLMQAGARILHVGTKDGEPNIQVWAEVDPEAPLVHRDLRVHVTGGPYVVEKAGQYVGTFQVNANGFVFVGHVFDRGELPS